MSYQLHALSVLPLGEFALGTHLVGGQVGPGACLDDMPVSGGL
jgi:hypothetical protein